MMSLLIKIFKSSSIFSKSSLESYMLPVYIPFLISEQNFNGVYCSFEAKIHETMTTSNDKKSAVFKSPENKWVLIWREMKGYWQRELLFLFYTNPRCWNSFYFFTKSCYFFRD